MFVGILAYADDMALLAPTAHAMRCMLSVCEAYAADFCVSSNAAKSKCIVCVSHLGHIISSDMDIVSDVDRCRHKLIGHVNNVMCSFH